VAYMFYNFCYCISSFFYFLLFCTAEEDKVMSKRSIDRFLK